MLVVRMGDFAGESWAFLDDWVFLAGGERSEIRAVFGEGLEMANAWNGAALLVRTGRRKS